MKIKFIRKCRMCGARIKDPRELHTTIKCFGFKLKRYICENCTDTVIDMCNLHIDDFPKNTKGVIMTRKGERERGK